MRRRRFSCELELSSVSRAVEIQTKSPLTRYQKKRALLKLMRQYTRTPSTDTYQFQTFFQTISFSSPRVALYAARVRKEQFEKA